MILKKKKMNFKNSLVAMIKIMWLLTLILPRIVRSTRPNFLFIIVDDLRPALGCYGDKLAHTPNLDRLAQESGVLFDKAYAQQALCAPSRNSLLTGRRPDTLGLYDFYSYWRDTAGNFTTLPQHLKNHGYETASFGKVFHPGISSNFSDDSPYSWSEKPFHPYTERFKNAPVCSSKSSKNSSNLICPVRVVSTPNSTLPDLETFRASKNFLNRNLKKPFFLAVGFQKPHIPLKYPKRFLKFHPLKKFFVPNNYHWPVNVSSVAYNPWIDVRQRSDVKKLKVSCPWGKIPKKFARKIIQSYYAAITYIDELIGKLLIQLKILNIYKNTVVIVTSDHGWSLGEHAEWSKYSNFDVSLRIPLIISIPNITFKWNKKIRDKNLSKIIVNPVELLDLFPTVSELAGIETPKCSYSESTSNTLDLCVEGTSFLCLINSSCKTKFWKNIAISQYPRSRIKPICKSISDKPRLKDITIMGYTLRNITYRYTVWVKFSHLTRKPNWLKVLAEELYNHKIDPDENQNLASLKNYKILKNELKKILINGLQ